MALRPATETTLVPRMPVPTRVPDMTLYGGRMGATAHAISLGDLGRLVIPIEVRDRHGWEAGTPLVAIDTDAGVLVMSADEGLAWLRGRVDGRDLVAELLDERRAEVTRDA